MIYNSDTELMTAIKSGNNSAFEFLCQKYQKRIFNFIFNKMNRKELAEEIIQETFLNVFRKKDLFKEADGKLVSWIFSIAKNTMIDSVRRKKHRQEILVDEMPDRGSYTNDIGFELSVNTAINNLPDNLKSAFNAVCIDGLDHNEAAKLLGINPDNVRARVSRARSNIRSELDAG